MSNKYNYTNKWILDPLKKLCCTQLHGLRCSFPLTFQPVISKIFCKSSAVRAGSAVEVRNELQLPPTCCEEYFSNTCHFCASLRIQKQRLNASLKKTSSLLCIRSAWSNLSSIMHTNKRKWWFVTLCLGVLKCTLGMWHGSEQRRQMQTLCLKDELQPTLSKAIRYARTNRSAY